MRLLDLFCKEGGAGAGFARAGFDVTGVDIDPQPRYPYRFVQGDALEFLAQHGGEFDVVHASPPCQRYSRAQRIQGREHPDYIAAVRDAMPPGAVYVIENVVGARAHLRAPVELCGAMFGLRLYRHRLFEVSVPVAAPAHPAHMARVAKMWRPPGPGEFMHVVGNFSGVALAREAMGMPWASRDGLREAVPPAYTFFIGCALG